VQPVFDLLKNGGPAQAFLNLVGDEGGIAEAVDAQAVGHVFKNRLGKGIGLLKNHAHPAPQGDDIGLGRVDVFLVNEDVALYARVENEVVHAVEAAQKGAFAAAGRADQGRDLPIRKGQADIVQSLVLPVKEVEMLGAHFCRRTGSFIVHKLSSWV